MLCWSRRAFSPGAEHAIGIEVTISIATSFETTGIILMLVLVILTMLAKLRDDRRFRAMRLLRPTLLR